MCGKMDAEVPEWITTVAWWVGALIGGIVFLCLILGIVQSIPGWVRSFGEGIAAPRRPRREGAMAAWLQWLIILGMLGAMAIAYLAYTRLF